MTVEFRDNTAKILSNIDKCTLAFLDEAKDSLAAQASRNSRVKSGALKRSFQSDSKVVDSEQTAYIGSSLDYALWQEFGTGEYALEGNGRKGGWVYLDPDTGKKVFTRGNKPNRMLYHAFQAKKEAIKRRGQAIFKGV